MTDSPLRLLEKHKPIQLNKARRLLAGSLLRSLWRTVLLTRNVIDNKQLAAKMAGNIKCIRCQNASTSEKSTQSQYFLLHCRYRRRLHRHFHRSLFLFHRCYFGSTSAYDLYERINQSTLK